MNGVTAAGAGTAGHVELTIGEVVFRIGQLQDVLRGLHWLKEMNAPGASGVAVMPGRSSASPVRTAQKETKGTEVKRQIAKGKVQASGPVTVVTMLRAELPRIGAAEFGADELKATVLRGYPEYRKKVEMGIYYAMSALVEKGELKRLRKEGKDWVYGKPAAGGQGLAGARPSGRKEEQAAMLKIAPASGPELERLQEELEEAIAKRDEHRSAGRTVLEGAEQKRVDKLIAKIKGT